MTLRTESVTFSSPSSDYLVQGIFGEGSFGKVVKCLKLATKEKVAVKIIKSSQYTDDVNEVYILQKLRAFNAERFNFVRFNEVFVYRQHICLEFEMLDISLLDFVKLKPRESLSVKEIRPILHQMATTLQLLSSLGVAHTDLKPDNIVMVDHVNQPLKIKMIDFGLARPVSQLNQCLVMQPLYYRSPEVILGLPANAAIDMWSLGCIAAELFLGHVLYPGCSEFHVLQRMEHVQGQMPQKLLEKGSRTKYFFKKKTGHRCWRLKTSSEYGEFTRYEGLFNSLDDLKKIRPPCHLSDDDTMAQIKDQEDFVDLLKQMLRLDNGKRITPGLLLEDPFITMTYLSHSFPDSS
ncbi:homeodomain-interacting protein kinase 1-like [Anarhichas minor]|uniref:homeodomain-interacting protein kinase 1-like n=1 Tax=Anarhichas minor TaxID=65739 RepID=UPI003F73C545